MVGSEHLLEPPVASVDRRFHALLVDRLLTWGIFAGSAFAAWWLFWREDEVWPGVALLAAVVLIVALVSAVALGVTGGSPGKALLGLRVVDADTGAPIGFSRALLRIAIVGLASLPTCGLGLAVMAWTAIEDPEGRRRGWHDRLVGSLVIDRRTAPAPAPEAADGPRPLVNLTAMRLAPVPTPAAPAPTPPPAPPAVPAPPPPPRPGRPPAATPRPPAGSPAAGSPAVDSPAPAAPAPPPAARPTHAPTARPEHPATVGRHLGPPSRWRLTADTGESIVLDGLVLLGRNPEGRPGEPVRHLLPLQSSDMSVSKTHLQVHLAPDGTLVVVDRGSTNGSFLLRQGVSRDLTSGRAVTLLPGDRIRLGDRELTVTKED